MKKVYVVGVGMTEFKKHEGKTCRDLVYEAVKNIHIDKGIDIKKDVEALFVGYFTPELYEHQGHIGVLIADWLGLNGKPAFRCESACASGSVAFITGFYAVSSGMYDVVMVAGVEKMTNLDTAGVTDALSVAADDIYELPTGITFPGLFALIAQQYFEKYKACWEDLQSITIKNHNNGAMNPKAQFQSTIMDIAKKVGQKKGTTFKDEMDFLTSTSNPYISFPLRLFDCCPISDGAAVVILASEDAYKNFTDKPIQVLGVGMGTDTICLSSRKDLTSSFATVSAAETAYKMSGLTAKDIDIAEVHDCFTINEVVISEDLGLFSRGEGIKAAKEGRTSIKGDIPINTDGGLKAKGHPVGATGIGMIHEIYLQLRGEAGARQVLPLPRIGLTCNVGGSGASSVVLIFGI